MSLQFVLGSESNVGKGLGPSPGCNCKCPLVEDAAADLKFASVWLHLERRFDRDSQPGMVM